MQVSRYRAPFAPGGSLEADAPLLTRVLGRALARGGDAADVFLEYRVIGALTLRDDVVRLAHRGVTCGAGVRVRADDCVGFCHVDSCASGDLLRAADVAARAAPGDSASPIAALEERAVIASHDVTRSSLEDDLGLKLALLRRAEAAARAFDPSVKQVECSLADELREIVVATSEGGLKRDRQPLVRFRVRVVAERGARRASGYSGGGGRHDLTAFADIEAHAREAARAAVAMLDARAAPAGPMPIVLAAGSGGVLLHEAIGHGLEVDFHRRGATVHAGELGHAIASSLCTLVDDATIPGSRGTIDVDDEGTETARNVLVERGVLRTLISSGNARRASFRTPPLPRMTNTVLEAGPHDPEEIIRSVSRGLYARTLGGGRVDVATGDFVFTVTEGYLVEDGRLTAPVSGVILVGSGPRVLRGMSMVGGDSHMSPAILDCRKRGQSVPVGVGCPTFLVDEMIVGGARDARSMNEALDVA